MIVIRKAAGEKVKRMLALNCYYMMVICLKNFVEGKSYE